MSKSSSNPWILLFPTAIGVLILNYGAHYLYMTVYENYINSGQKEAFYDQYSKDIAPYSAIVAGIPLMYLAARWLGGKFIPAHAIRAAIWMWLTYMVIELAILYFAGDIIDMLTLFVASFATKLGAAYLGGQSAHRSFS